MRPTDQSGLNAIYEELESRIWLKNKEDQPKLKAERTNSNYELVLNEKSQDTWIKQVNKAKTVAVATETTGMNYMDA